MPHSSFQQALADQLGLGVLFVDADRIVRFWNAAAERLTGIESAAIVGQPWSPQLIELRIDAQRIERDCLIERALRTGEPGYARVDIRGYHGRLLPVEAQLIPVGAPDSARHGVVATLRDLSVEVTLEDRCHRLADVATRDPLTGIANRAEFDRVHDLCVSMHHERQAPYSLIMTDIDHFKSINDVFGHPAGDDVLRQFSHTLKNACRLGDFVARYGGEEFAVLLAHCDGAAAAERAEGLRKLVAQTPQIVLGGRHITASFGVTEICADDTAERMLQRADRALFCAKERGRNQVVSLVGAAAVTPSMTDLVLDLRRAITGVNGS